MNLGKKLITKAETRTTGAKVTATIVATIRTEMVSKRLKYIAGILA